MMVMNVMVEGVLFRMWVMLRETAHVQETDSETLGVVLEDG